MFIIVILFVCREISLFLLYIVIFVFFVKKKITTPILCRKNMKQMWSVFHFDLKNYLNIDVYFWSCHIENSV